MKIETKTTLEFTGDGEILSESIYDILQVISDNGLKAQVNAKSLSNLYNVAWCINNKEPKLKLNTP